MQNSVSLSKQVAIMPTLIICQGKFGRAVGLQLVGRLSLMQAALTQEGFTGSLIARVSNNDLVPGLIRIMELDWDRWLFRNLEHEHFLRDIEIPSVNGSQKVKHRILIDPYPDPVDVDRIQYELPKLKGRLRAACEPLRLHYTNKLGVNSEFRLRLIIVCSAREGTVPILTHDLVKVLGDFYNIDEKLTSGIQMFCYVGGTSQEEHVAAGGTKEEYGNDQHQLPKKERELVLGTKGPKREPGFLEWLMELWNHSNLDVAHILESCYLLDAQLANGYVPIPEHLDEPSEVVLATTLALMSFIATNTDVEIRQSVSRRSTQASGVLNSRTNPPRKRCLFASFGVASYCVDHPKLHRLVHSWLMDHFLCSVLHLPDDPKGVLDDNKELQIQFSVKEPLARYQDDTVFANIDQFIMQEKDQKAPINFSQLVTKLSKRNVTRPDLENALKELATKISTKPMGQYLQDYQQWQVEALRKKVQEHSHRLYNAELAPLTSAYRFLQACFDHISQLTDPLLDLHNAVHEQPSFTSPLDKYYQRVEKHRIDTLEKIVQKCPTRSNAAGHALLIVAVVAVAFPINIPLFLTLAAMGLMGLALTSGIYVLHSSQHRRTIRHELKRLTNLRQTQLQETREYAWKWALVEFKTELQNRLQHMQQLCEPDKEIITTLRQELLNQSLLPKDHVLERTFLNDQLIQELKQQFIEDPDEGLRLWEWRVQILKDIEELLRNNTMLTNTQKALKIERLLRDQVEKLYQGNAARITHIISCFLEKRNTYRLDEIYRTLSDAAVPFLRYTVDEQDNAIVHLETFGVYDKQEGDNLDNMRIKVTNSIDRLHWLFMRVDVGIHFEQINFSIATLAPP